MSGTFLIHNDPQRCSDASSIEKTQFTFFAHLTFYFFNVRSRDFPNFNFLIQLTYLESKLQLDMALKVTRDVTMHCEMGEN